MRKKKGEYGYRKYFKIKNGIMIAFLIFVIIVLFVLSKKAAESESRILLVSSILMVLPMANLAAPFLTVFGYRSVEYERIRDFDGNEHFMFDIILTVREQVMPLDVIFIDGSRIFAFLSSSVNVGLTEAFIRERMKTGGIKVNVKVCTNFNEFLKFAVNTEFENNEKLGEIKAILKSLSV